MRGPQAVGDQAPQGPGDQEQDAQWPAAQRPAAQMPVAQAGILSQLDAQDLDHNHGWAKAKSEKHRPMLQELEGQVDSRIQVVQEKIKVLQRQDEEVHAKHKEAQTAMDEHFQECMAALEARKMSLKQEMERLAGEERDRIARERKELEDSGARLTTLKASAQEALDTGLEAPQQLLTSKAALESVLTASETAAAGAASAKKPDIFNFYPSKKFQASIVETGKIGMTPPFEGGWGQHGSHVQVSEKECKFTKEGGGSYRTAVLAPAVGLDETKTVKLTIEAKAGDGVGIGVFPASVPNVSNVEGHLLPQGWCFFGEGNGTYGGGSPYSKNGSVSVMGQDNFTWTGEITLTIDNANKTITLKNGGCVHLWTGVETSEPLVFAVCASRNSSNPPVSVAIV